MSLEGVLRFFAGVGEFGSGLKKGWAPGSWSVRTGYLGDSLLTISPSRAPGTQNHHEEHDGGAFFYIKIINSFNNPLPPSLVIRY